MVRTVLASVWFLGTVAALFLGMNGTLDPAAMVVFSLAGLGMFYAFAFWSVFVNTREPEPRSIQ